MPEPPGNDGDYNPPPWSMPPRMIGGHVTGPVVIGRSDQAVVAARQVLAFAVGLAVEVEAHGRGTVAIPAGVTGADDLARGCGLRFRLRFSDGREAAQDDETGLRSGYGPTLIHWRSESESGYWGPDGREDARLALWAWPLPPPGPVTLTCAWPKYGLGDVSLVLDGHAIRAAARHAQPFWPVPAG